MPARLPTAALRLAPAPGPADRDLLAAFATGRDEAAFTELVRRHGGLVLAACRRIAGHTQDAEDAFQAAFLVLARRAGQVGRPDQLANWLYGVAVRTALDARRARRRIREHPLAAADPAAAPAREPDPDLAGIVDEELARLPDKYRAAVVLCELEGVPRKAAAARLRVPEGTLSSRLAHARKLLADRLTRRGVVAPAVLFAAPPLAGGVPARLIDSLARAAARATGGPFPPGLVSDRVSSLTDGVLKAMLVSKLRLAAGAAVLVAAAVGAAAVVGQSPQPRPTPTPSIQPPATRLPQVPDKTPEKVAAKGIDDDDVPYPTAPAPAVVRFEGGQLVVRQRSRFSPAAAAEGGVRAATRVVGKKYDAADALVFDMKGNRLAAKAWREKFETDQHALVVWGGMLPNPRELVLFKDDTLLVVLPHLPAGPADGVVVPRTALRAVVGPDGMVRYEPVTSYEYATPAPSVPAAVETPMVPFSNVQPLPSTAPRRPSGTSTPPTPTPAPGGDNLPPLPGPN